MARLDRLRPALAALACAALASCGYNLPMRATFIDGGLAFVIASDASVQPGCLHQVIVSAASGESVWEAEGMPARPCPAWTPLRYGLTPPGLALRVAPVRLRSGTLYVLSGYDGDTLHAAFRLHREGGRLRVENLPWTSPQVRHADIAAQDWRDARDRRLAEARALAERRAQADEGANEGRPFEDRPLPAEQH